MDLLKVDPDYLMEFPDNVRLELIQMNQEIWQFELASIATMNKEDDLQRDVLAQKQSTRAVALAERRQRTQERIQQIRMDSVQQLKEKERKWTLTVKAYLDIVSRKLEAKKKEEEEKRKKEEDKVRRARVPLTRVFATGC